MKKFICFILLVSAIVAFFSGIGFAGWMLWRDLYLIADFVALSVLALAACLSGVVAAFLIVMLAMWIYEL